MPTAASAIRLCSSYTRPAAIVIVSFSLAGCFDESSDAEPARDSQTSTSAPPAPAPPPAATPPRPETNHPPEISGVPNESVQVGQTYAFTPTASDVDQDALAFSATNVPAWAQFSSATGVITGAPGDSDVGHTPDITISVTDGHDSRSIGPFRIHIHPRDAPPSRDNSAPTISGSADASVSVNHTYSFAPTAADADGDALSFSISNRPSWARFSSSTGRLSGAPTTAHIATYSNIVISVNDGRAAASLPPFSIEVHGLDNRAPTISGSPATDVQASQAYSFQPAASDVDDDALTFSIANRPAWASFSTANGRLRGTPTSAHVGSYSNIVISVSDGRTSASLPAFGIEVSAAPNRPPTISGAPPTSITAGLVYSFRPNGSDPDGDSLTYSIENRPPWLTFDTSTGRLYGTPLPTDAGSYANIVIVISDGSASASLPTFALTVSQPSTGSAALSWAPPTQNTDGSALTDLAGFRIRYGTSSSSLNQLIEIATPGVAAYVVTNLDSGTWYFAVEAYNERGVTSSPSGVARMTIH